MTRTTSPVPATGARWAAAASRLVAPPPARGPASTVVSLVLFALGAALGCGFLASMGMPAFVGAITVITTVWACAGQRRIVTLRVVALALSALVHLFWAYQAIVLTVMLAWSVPPLLWALDAVVALAAAAGVARATARFHVPISLPLGIAIAALLGGWSAEDGLVRCDDYLRVRHSAVAVVIPSTPELERCAPGESLRLHRYPRRVWESADGHRFVVTTQPGRGGSSERGRAVPPWFDGTVCRVDTEKSGEPPSCFGDDGKGEAIVESPELDRLYVAVFGYHEGWVYALSRDGRFEQLGEAHMGAATGEMYVDAELDQMGLFADDAAEVPRLRASDLQPLEPAPVPIAPDQVHYDQRTHRGIACFAVGPLRSIEGEAFAAVAFEGDGFRPRLLAPSSRYPSSWFAATWGCTWDLATRRAYVGIASLGLLEQIDYDTGDVVDRSFAGFGMRSLAFDARRHRVYAAIFLTGDVIAIDVASGRVVDRWFTGRFVRYVTLSRDGEAILATSNVGVVRIPLGVER